MVFKRMIVVIPILISIVVSTTCFAELSGVFEANRPKYVSGTKGVVKDADTGEPLPGANVILVGTRMGAATNVNGEFRISGVPYGRYIVRATMMGYESREVEILLNVSTYTEIQFRLKPMAVKGKAVVVTGTRVPRYLKDTPVRTNVITREEIKRRNPVNVLNATKYVVGVDPQIECSICNASSISIQGLPGRYTQVLIDGMPIFSSLGQTYGYMELPASIIDQIEIIKGASSVLYGTDAIAGIVNIRTSNPSPFPALSLDSQIGQYGERRMTGAASYKRKAIGLLVNGEYYHMNPVDRNGDGISEFTGTTRAYMSGKLVIQKNTNTDLRIRFSGLTEERQGGALSASHSFIEVLDQPALRAFSESILTRRMDAALIFRHQFSKADQISYKLSLTKHFQDSDYEGFVYVGDQLMTYNDFQWNHHIGAHHLITSGLAFRTEKLKENVAVSAYDYKIASIFAQYDWRPNPLWESVLGVRFDHHNVYGKIVTPSLSLKAVLGDHWTTRLTLGKGFRAPTSFYELDHGTGAKYKYNTRYLAKKAEQSRSVTVSVDYEKGATNVSLAPFYHRIENYITAYNDYASKSFVVENVESPSSIYGIELNYSRFLLPGLFVTIGHIWERYNMAPNVLGFARPENRFKWALNYDWPKWNVSLNLDGQVAGPMNLREVYGMSYNADGTPKLTKSPTFWILNIDINKKFKNGMKLILGAKNLLDFQQLDAETPLMYNEKGELGDVVYIWGPLLGRKLYASFSVDLE